MFGDITSANIVGYANTDEIGASKFTLGTASFEAVGSDGLVAVKDMVKTSIDPVGYNDRETEGAMLQVWNGSAYDFFYYINDAGDNYDETGWADDTGYVTDMKVAPGTGYWYKAPAKSTFTLAGQVVNADTVTKDLPANSFQLMGNPYPTALLLANITTTIAPVGYNDRESDGVMLQVWNGSAYDFYYYINDAGDNYDETGWADDTGYVITDIVADGTKGLWAKSPKAAGKITFAK